MITAYKPNLEDLWFREKLMSDEETMSYNPGGTLPFPRERWAKWYSKWVDAPENERYYRYLYDTEAKNLSAKSLTAMTRRRRPTYAT